MITRDITSELLQSAAEFPVVTILGPRQSGKTTLARMVFPGKPYLSLEDLDVRMAAEADPRGFLAKIGDGAVLGEAQRLPALLSYLQGVVDQSEECGRFILTGSHQPMPREAVSQSLAGRTAMLTLWPFSFHELSQYGPLGSPYDLIVRGFFPRLHKMGLSPRRFYNGYLSTYVERDLPALIQLRDLSQFQKFLALLAGRVGSLVNLASLGNDIGVSGTTLRHWLSILKESHVVFELPPYFESIKRRLVKSPKLYFADVGLAAFLLGIRTPRQAWQHPLRGHLYENLVISEILKGASNKGIRPDLYFFRDSMGNEVDLLINENSRLFPVEIKSGETSSPDFVKGIERLRALGVMRLETGAVLYNGQQSFNIRGVRIFNPLHVNDLWSDLTMVPEDFGS